ncbi:MAG: DUF1573 domain-containing protein [Candidatus Omnitrophica bacterium]|nr:DUF1573 domain-containing protein [Candidatus Omnitrophota bacterium]
MTVVPTFVILRSLRRRICLECDGTEKMRTKKFLLGMLIWVVFLGTAVRGGAEEIGSLQGNEAKNGKIEIDEYKWDIGDIPSGMTAKKTFLIKNTGEGELFIEGIRAACKCIKTKPFVKNIPPKQSIDIEMTYDSTGREEGEDKKRVYICSNDPVSPRVLIELNANIISAKEENATPSAKTKAGTVNIYVFVDTECEECVKSVREYITPVAAKYNINMVTLDTNLPNYFELLLSAEECFKKTPSTGPVILFNDGLMREDEIISGSFEKKMESSKGKTLPFFDLETLKSRENVKRSETEPKEIKTILFSTKKYCGKCRQMEKYLAFLSKKYPKFSVKTFYVEDPESVLFYEYAGNKLNVREDKILSLPAFVIGTRYFTEKDQYHPAIELCIQESGREEVFSGDQLYEEFKRADNQMLKNKISRRFENFEILPVAIAGLVDGINPCAFGTIIFFVTSLFVVRKKKRIVLAAGFLFISATFLTYFLIGIGVLRVSSFLIMKKLGPFVYSTAAMVLFVLSFLSLMDCVNYLRNRKDKIILQLSEKQKERISRLISKNIRLKYIAGAVVVTAFIVSITELTCTGQIYLPTILYILKTEQLKAGAIGLLCLYNIAFILPLVVVFCVFFFVNPGSYQFIRLAKKNAAIAKFLLFLCFLGLGVMFLFMG